MRFLSYNSQISIIVVIILLFSGFAWRDNKSAVQAATADELRNKIENSQSEIQKLEKEIQTFRQEITKTQQEKNSLNTEIKKIDLTRQKLGSEIKLTQNQIKTTEKQIAELANGIQDKETAIEHNRAVIAESMRLLAGTDDESLLVSFLASESLSEFWNSADQLAQVNNRLIKLIAELNQNKKQLTSTKVQKEVQKKDLSVLTTKLSDQKQLVDQTKQEKNSLLSATQSKETAYQKLLQDRLAKKRAVEAEMQQAEAQLKVVLDPNRLPDSGTKALRWPLDKIIITQYFGNTAFALQNAAVYNGKGHNGIDLAADVGTPLKAANSGKVIGVGDTDNTCQGASYGKWILIQHNNGLSTLYAHLSLIKIGEGQTVESGQLIGYTGNTGYSTGPHLHFTVYASQGVQVGSLKSKVPGCGTYRLPIASYNSYLNPLNYL
ncbi:MAG TPA: peptidoglycan DD-metalloendopeptidase family protein [Candidatus Paceibacterota bacterium]|jgi:murein DD-endopeptidase MepM/ murein hydrolase activator NlpD|nr:peptidoglycan DD-metalloendopeptidase family protein [Candidatus Paceibacterota bacterium]HOH11493.1 peptidoglycan DD-metalloendopeptidase family protein [Candidatus Paceibacterota bacterium]HOY11087.1 peptidoglycan DD-metalloendopeptidase family protein [Candidatus Paceibacterota bacterium]HPB60433.1 peptidoglycan DD-metalloendopeptidase family protein [Candidatus Paceibacterota bacterium]HPI24420.1 peptidoglycan DD-metalloendopeptidase family protein [Candidatus Paceibacterota bacterium]